MMMVVVVNLANVNQRAPSTHCQKYDIDQDGAPGKGNEMARSVGLSHGHRFLLTRFVREHKKAVYLRLPQKRQFLHSIALP
ncbi:MAG: hypothetical protein Nkreftii_003485 [Candidatus Nitrospira kreftii]|uniref:Uncharacterized protein n=1 Tax=Candidatus Nitrospira kreftii TaxID=2652173 RepID=A0A7S8FH41_9BACT|nr:MAG: hypothetical protein Nkreftii_003485 [Candidatus Nitrospira kreftii]